MSVARHLGIELGEYDARIRGFVPGYGEMLAEAAGALARLAAPHPVIVDLGIGTGALAAACLAVRPGARLIGIDADAAMLEGARARLAALPGIELRQDDFTRAELPSCDAIVACLALHHVRTPEAKGALYRRCAATLRTGGCLVTADRFVGEGSAADAERATWIAHLERTYSTAEAEEYLSTWAEEDVYFPLAQELRWIGEAGLEAEMAWRRDGFAVLVGRRISEGRAAATSRGAEPDPPVPREDA